MAGAPESGRAEPRRGEPRQAGSGAPARPEPGAAAHRTLDRVVRDHAGRLAGTLIRLTGDFATAEDLVQDAVVAALRRWPAEGIPDRPDAWLYTVARNRGLDLLRREETYREKLAQLVRQEDWPYGRGAARDDRLRLVFTCCHPALSREARIALTLRVVCGLTTAQIARAFLVRETTVAQRITRAKRRIAEAGIPYRVPAPDEQADRLTEVLAVIYLLFNEGYLATADRADSRDLADDAEWLAALLHGAMPAEPEVAGLLALIRLHRARGAARFRDGGLVRLRDQDRSLWDRAAIERAAGLLVRAIRRRRPGPYQLQAAIVACHAEAGSWEETDWEQIVLLYDMLLHLAPSPVTRLHRAVALRYTAGPAAALAETGALAAELSGYHLFHATRADLLRALGRRGEAGAADRRALELTANPAERAVLRERLDRG
ncbi:RNA polymerase sigma factor [Streptomyces synnematoformans]|uniref:RNA polymerase sigma factor n=1 Tax=Streptomyces synnematoformans TaxID=415721 RepID=A0ABN2XSB2_9ACTN